MNPNLMVTSLVLAAGLALSANAQPAYLVKDITPGADIQYPSRGVDLHGIHLFFADDRVHGYELWRTDATEAGTWLLKDINPTPGKGSHIQDYRLTYFDPGLTATPDFATFFADDGTHGPQLWRTDGTKDGTEPIRNLSPGFWKAVAVGNLIVFFADDGIHGVEPWITDGTPEGTALIKDVNPGPGGCNPTDVVASNGLVFFLARGADPSMRVFRSDGSEAGTSALAFSDSWGSNGLFGYPILLDVSGTVFFSNADGRELWKTDGTAAGTRLVKTFSYARQLGNFVTARGMLFFLANDGIHGLELWESDGAEAGTFMVKDVVPENWGRGFVDCLAGCNWDPILSVTGVGEHVFFAALETPPRGYALWWSDGTESGTRRVKAIGIPHSDTYPVIQMLAHNGMLYFNSDDGVHGNELWRSDGTPAGTVLVQDISPGASSSSPSSFQSSAAGLYFNATTPEAGTELWFLPDRGVLRLGPSPSPRPHGRRQ
jgi:ELWxxDGT repeat protein